MSEEDKILKVLEKLEELKKRGLIDEKYYREKRNLLLSKYLEVSNETHDMIEQHPQPKYSNRSKRLTKPLPILLLVISIILILVVVGNVIQPFIKVATYTTTITIEKPVTITKEYMYTITQIMTSTVMFYDQSPIYNGFSNIPEERIVYSGSLYLERDCQVRVFSVNVEKGDIIKVYWEADDDDAYLAIGTPSHYTENVKSKYCEILLAFWRYSWPKADYGYSGTLQFTVSSSGTWYVVIANGNSHCIFSECPITITKLEIKHIKS